MNNEEEFNYKIAISRYKNDNNLLEELKYIKDNISNYNFLRFRPGFFTKENLQRYNNKEILDASNNFKDSILKYGLESEINLKKVKFYLNSKLIKIDEKVVTSNILNIENLEKINNLISNNLNYEKIFLDLYSVNDFNNIKIILNNKKKLKNAEFLSAHFELSNLNNKFFETIIKDDFSNFINKINDDFLTTKMELNDFIDLYNIYKENKNLMNNLNSDEFTDYLINYKNISFKLVEKKDYYIQKKENILKKIDLLTKSDDKNNINEIKELISNTYFNRDYKITKDIINDTIELLNIYNIKFEEFNNFKKFIYINDIKEFKQYLNEIEKNTNITKKLLDVNKPLAKKNIVEKLNNFNIIGDKDIINLNGEKFYLLVHKIIGYGKNELANEIYDNPSNWYMHKDPDSYISTSLISDKFLGTVNSIGFILGFNHINEKEIIQMGPKDIEMNRRIHKNGLNNILERNMTADSLIENTSELYNEIDLKRYIKDNVKNPDCVISIDKINEKDRQISEYFKIPIINIDSNIYFDKRIKLFYSYMKNNDYIKATKLLMNIYKGFICSDYAKDKCLNYEYLSSYLYNFIERETKSNISLNKANELKEIVNSYDKMISAITYLDKTYKFIAKKDLNEKINIKTI